MIDLDIYCPNIAVEKFLEQLKVRLKKDCPTTTVYISTANPYNSWLQKLYKFYYNTESMEEQHENILLPRSF
jgi:hypothetical protein